MSEVPFQKEIIIPENNGGMLSKTSNKVFLYFILLGVLFWTADSFFQYYFFSSNLHFMINEVPESVVDSMLFTASAYSIFVRLIFLIFCIIGGFLISLHIKRREAAEDDLRHSEEKFRSLAESSQDLILLTSGGRDVEYINPAVKKILGYSPEDVIGRDFLSFVSPESGNKIIDVVNNIHRVKGRTFLLRINRSDDTEALIEFSLSSIDDGGGNSDAVQYVGRDLSEWIEAKKQYEEALIQIENNLNQFAILNDEIRNPLAIIVGTADFLGHEESEIILGQAGIIDGLVADLDRKWLESSKIREFLIKHYNFSFERINLKDE
ncbi:PAS domain S-box protein [Methanoplanus endosymbiosus]|uniref:histidine kinase n=1 Tax=Methanoplanus endosymbiosus TaxID=33865 RepID=A0A9E7PJU3_9EURY|nr:PAS domain S-box protein [Methanoplanus endosymbiosus]UUX91280.1 PAS domain S-box protein [Methanoplanus endosymbiosus]